MDGMNYIYLRTNFGQVLSFTWPCDSVRVAQLFVWNERAYPPATEEKYKQQLAGKA